MPFLSVRRFAEDSGARLTLGTLDASSELCHQAISGGGEPKTGESAERGTSPRTASPPAPGRTLGRGGGEEDQSSGEIISEIQGRTVGLTLGEISVWENGSS